MRRKLRTAIIIAMSVCVVTFVVAVGGVVFYEELIVGLNIGCVKSISCGPADGDKGVSEIISNYDAIYTRVGGSGSAFRAMAELAENSSEAVESTHLPIIKIKSKEELTTFYEKAEEADGLYPDSFESDGESFKAVVDKYDDEFFKENTLFVVYVKEGSGSVRHKLSELEFSNGRMTASITAIVPEAGTCDMADWFITFEATNEMIEDCVAFDSVYLVQEK